MGQVGNYEALIRELLGEVKSDWGYGNVKGWLMGKVKEPELAGWLREHGAALGADEVVRGQLGCLAGVGRGELAEVAGELLKGWEPEVDEAEEWFDRGNELFELGRYEEAIASFDRAIEIKYDYYEAVYNRGFALAILGRYEEAISSFELAIEFRPDFYEAWSSLGSIVGTLGRNEEAIDSFNQAIKINPDYAEAWYNRGNALRNSGRNEEAIDSFNQAIKINPNYAEAWYDRGNALRNSGRYEETIDSYEQAIEINPDYHEAWSIRGSTLNDLGRDEEAIDSFEQAIEINSNVQESWYGRGNALRNLERHEEAIASYDRATEINLDYDEAWHNRGIALYHLERHEEAIESFDRAIEINPDPTVWSDRGVALGRLDRYEEAIDSYDRAIEIKPDYHEAWFGRGGALVNLNRYEEAIDSYDRAIEINPDDHEYWYLRSISIGLRDGSYRAEIEAYQEAFTHIRPETHPEGWGFLQHKIGRIYHKEGNNQLLNYRRDPHISYGQALTSYHNALTTLTRDQFPKLRIETLIDTAKTYLAQKQPSAARECQIEANDILGDLLNAEPTFAGKKRLQLEYVSLSQLDVDLFVASGDNIRALETAERDKNNHLIWLLTALDETIISHKYAQMQQLLTASEKRTTGIIYWHLSPDDITTFILHPNNPNPQILTNSSQQLKQWLETYDTDKLDTANWQELSSILQISEINHHLDGIEHLILIPHRDLHRLPLHTYWQNLTTTYLPSIQIGLNLQAKPQPDRSAGFLLVESPNYSQPTKLKDNLKSFDPLTNPEIESAIIAHFFQPKTTIPMGKVSKTNLCAAFNTPHTYGHFNGHAYHDSRRPQDSSLVIDGGELTCQDLAQIDLTPYYLISLSACQTGITTHQTIETEYVGLVSAFLSRGTNYVVSTLWSVKDLPSSMLMMVFYIYIRKGMTAPIALRQAAQWLKNLTYAKEAEFHRNIYQRLPQNSPTEQSTARITERNRQNAETAAKEQPDAKPYSSQKYWAAFTISGWG